MCYSEKASWGALGIGVSGIVAFVLARRRSGAANIETAAVAFSLTCIVAIQLFEALMWRNQRLGDLGDGSVERITMVVSSLQPLLMCIALLLYHVLGRRSLRAVGAWWGGARHVAFVAAFAAIYAFFALRDVIDRVGYVRSNALTQDCLFGEGSCRLRWDWTELSPPSSSSYRGLVFYVLAVLVAVTLIRDTTLRWTIVVVLAIALGVSFLAEPPLYSKWCFFAAALPWAAAIATYVNLV